jgi:hypothetical protein
MEAILLVLFALAAAAFVTRPFWSGGADSVTEDPAVAALEAARDHKFREIRDAETDLATGKLTQADYNRISAELRSDASSLLARLDRAKEHAERE